MAELSPLQQRLVTSHKALADRTAVATRTQISTLWRAMPNTSDAELLRFGRTAAQITNTSKLRAAAGEDAFYAQFASDTLNKSFRPRGVDAKQLSTQALRDVDDATLWHRPAATVWTSLGEGHPIDVAMQRGLYRATEIAESQLRLARDRTAQLVLPQYREVDGYVRMPSRRGCSLCRAAGVRRYEPDERMPSHLHCHCAIVPSFREKPTPTFVAPDEKIAAAPSKREEEIVQSVESLLDDVRVSEHGELGPQLTWADQSFTGPGSLA